MSLDLAEKLILLRARIEESSLYAIAEPAAASVLPHADRGSVTGPTSLLDYAGSVRLSRARLESKCFKLSRPSHAGMTECQK